MAITTSQCRGTKRMRLPLGFLLLDSCCFLRPGMRHCCKIRRFSISQCAISWIWSMMGCCRITEYDNLYGSHKSSKYTARFRDVDERHSPIIRLPMRGTRSETRILSASPVSPRWSLFLFCLSIHTAPLNPTRNAVPFDFSFSKQASEKHTKRKA